MQGAGACTGAFPFFKTNSPERAEDNDAGYVEGPAGKFVADHLAFAHSVEEELEVPGGPGQSTKQIVAQHGRAKIGGGRGFGGAPSSSALAPAIT